MFVGGYGGGHHGVLHIASANPVRSVHDVQVLEGSFNVRYGAVGVGGAAAFKAPQFSFKSFVIFYFTPFR